VVEHQVLVFVVPRAPMGAAPTPTAPLTVVAADHDAAREAARAELAARGQRIRALSFGPKGLVAYVEEPA